MTDPVPTAPAADRLRDLLAIRPVRPWLLGQIASAFGDNALWIACGIWVRELTGSTAAAGLLVFVLASPQVLASPFAGLVTDRVNRKRFLSVVNLCGAAVVLPMLLVHNRRSIWVIYLSIAAYGIVSAALNTTQSALLTEVVPRQLLSTASGVIRGARESLRIVAPVTGAALLTSAGAPSVILLDAVSFLAAALFTWRLQAVSAAPPPRSAGVFRELIAGARFTWSHGLLRRVGIAGALAFGAYGLSETVIYAISNLVQRPPGFVGVLASTGGVGGVIGGISGVQLVRTRGGIALSVVGLALLACSCPLQASGLLPLVLTGEAVFGLSLPWVSIGLYTLIQLHSPSHLQGRVYGAFEVSAGIPQILAIAGGAGLITVLNVRYLLGGMAALAAAGAITLLPHARNAEKYESRQTSEFPETVVVHRAHNGEDRDAGL